jgi:DNA-damage-inducible protein J
VSWLGPAARPSLVCVRLFGLRCGHEDDVVRPPISAELKANAAPELAACGLELREVIRLFLQQVVASRGLPFEIRSAGRDPSMAELQSLKRRSQERDHRIANAMDVSKGEMLLLRPERLRGAKVRWPKVNLV